MKVSIKDLKLGSFDIELEPTDTVEAIRQNVIERQDATNVEVVLIYSGRVLKDTDVIQELEIKPTSSIICLRKPKPAKKSEPAGPSRSTTAAEPVTPAGQTLTAIPPAPTAPIAPATTDFLARASALSNAPRNPEFEASLLNLTQLGFGATEATWALNETDGNVESAADLLMAAQEVSAEDFEGAPPVIDTSSGRPNIIINRNQLDDFLNNLAQNAPEQFDQVVAALQNNPEQLVRILETMDVQRRQAFLQLLQSDPLGVGADVDAEEGERGPEPEDEEEYTTGAVPAEPTEKDVQSLATLLQISEDQARVLLRTHLSVENAVDAYFMQ